MDRPNLYGWTALMQACKYGHDGVVMQLLNSKASPSVTTPMGLTALSLAIHGGFPKVSVIFKESFLATEYFDRYNACLGLINC